ncbi:hypothetical protein [Streptomyces sp. NPDC098781]|uniref:hypothetical protein n=1 Tax=Streptomyces sp. NPDC098781 TaxID=3366097 RepID=UPI00380E98B6
MGSDIDGGTVVTRRANRFVTTGCLTTLIALAVVLGLVVSWLWYRHWHDENVNSDRSDKAFASLRKQARATADDTARALTAGGTTDPDALTGVIWHHSQAPVITYDPSRREFTATAARTTQYDEDAMLPGGGPVEATRCFVSTYTHRPDRTWTARVSERDDDVCRPSTQIGSRVRLALTRISSMHAEDLTRTGVQDALDPTGRRSFEVRNVEREQDTLTISVLVSSSEAAANQCYRFTRRVPDQGSAEALPLSSC